MAGVKIGGIVDHLNLEMRKALEIAVNSVIDDAEFDSRELFKAFRRAIGRKCSAWETVPDDFVKE